MSTRDKNFWILLVFLMAGVVLGGLLGEFASKVSWLWWLGYGKEFGLSNPITLDLSVLKLTFGLTLKINMAAIIGIALSIFVYRKV